VKLTDYSIDDLHQLALAESLDDEHAQQMLCDVYASLLREYITAIQLARGYQQ
jgi:hypothetical protein